MTSLPIHNPMYFSDLNLNMISLENLPWSPVLVCNYISSVSGSKLSATPSASPAALLWFLM